MSGFVQLYASSGYSAQNHFVFQQENNLNDFVDFDAYHQCLLELNNSSETEHMHQLFAEIADVEDSEENEEKASTSDSSQSFAFFNSARLHAAQCAYFSSQLKREFLNYEHVISKPSLRLYLKFQVFII